MLITGARVALDSESTWNIDLWLEGDRVWFSPPPHAPRQVLDLSGFIVLPGLINAHDHLELNLFPRLGRGVYPNATAWAEDVYHPDSSPVKDHLAVPKATRMRWGAIKNLLSGVTTVAHHNPLPSSFCRRNLPVRLVTRYGWAHSLRFCPDWKERFQATSKQYPFIMHAAEGTDESASQEIDILACNGALNASTVLVHGVAVGQKERATLENAGCSLVWCPSSNYFLFGRSLAREVLDSTIPIALGTDSAITATGDLLDEIRVAHAALPAERLYAMVTTKAAQILKLPTGFGMIRNGGPADLLVVRDQGSTPAISLLRAAAPDLVIVRGRIELASEDWSLRNWNHLFEDYSVLKVEKRGVFLIRQKVKSLIQKTEEALETQPRLAGKAIAA